MQLPTHQARRWLAWSSSLTLTVALLSWQILSVNNSELVHFLQYAIPGFALMAMTRCLTEAVAWTTLLGGFDEWYQYQVLHPNWGIPYDFNDVYLDLLGGAMGALVCAAFLVAERRASRQPLRLWRRPGVLVLLAIALAILVLIGIGKVAVYDDRNDPRYWFALSRLLPKGLWFFDATWGPRRIHILSPMEGPLLIAGSLLALSSIDRRFRFHLPGSLV